MVIETANLTDQVLVKARLAVCDAIGWGESHRWEHVGGRGCAKGAGVCVRDCAELP